MRKQYLKKICAVAIAVLTVFLNTAVNISADELSDNQISANADAQNSTEESNDYFTYYNRYCSIDKAADSIVLDSSTAAAQNKEPQYQTVSDGKGLILDSQNNSCYWQVNVPKDARYYIYVYYYPLEDTGKDILFSCKVDGEYPYSEATGFSLPRLWADETTGKFETDAQGNDMRPQQIEKPAWTTYAVQDIVGLYEEPYFIYLTAGTHTLSFEIAREKMLLGNITLKCEAETVSYEEYISSYSDKDYYAGNLVLQQAENTYVKSSSTLFPVYDRTTTATQPSDYAHIRLNTIGKGNWGRTGMSISWKAEVKEAGLYQLAFRARQDTNQGMDSCRTLSINGKTPFKEAENIVFPYSYSWYIKVLGDENPQYVYLEPGDIITLTVSAGPMSFALREIKQSILNLNELYRKIILITGLSPDMYQDYNLEDRIPGLCDELYAVRNKLQEVSDSIKKQMSKSDALLSSLNRSIQIYTELADDPYTIPERLSNYKDSIENLGSLILTLGSQPLELDYLAYIPKGDQAPKAGAPFFSQLKYSIMKFISSFADDYAAPENKPHTDELSVWVATGRDQVQTLNQMIGSDFSTKHDTVIHLNMVNTGDTLIQATLAGQGPDVALMIPEITPVNLAMRGELVPLNSGKYDIEDLYSQFPKAAWTPFYYLDNLYAMPETMTFDVLFYRTDIFEELNITPPSTWEDFYNVMRVIQSNNLLVAVPEVNSLTAGVSASIGIFDKFLLQNGGTYYTKDNSKTAFDQNVAIKAFEKWAELYTVYGLDRDINFYNRFRSGEAVMGIMPYTQYNLLSAGALELDGTWTFTVVPGVRQEDGTVNRAETANVTACIMLSSAVEKGVDDSAYLGLLSIDTTFGDVPEHVANECTPHFLKAFEDFPDGTSPFLWVYPFKEYSTLSCGRLSKPYFEDRFIVNAINAGFPLNTVVSTDNFIRLTQTDFSFDGVVIVTPVPERNQKINKLLIEYAENGGQVILYGSLTGADEDLLKALHLNICEPVSGEAEAFSFLPCDIAESGEEPCTVVFSDANTDGGAEAQLADDTPIVLSEIKQGGQKRVTGVAVPQSSGGELVWIRGNLCENPEQINSAEYMRYVLKRFGYHFEYSKKQSADRPPIVLISRNQNAFWFSCFNKNQTVGARFKLPLGAPVFIGMETFFEDGYTNYHLPRSLHAECRAFVKQSENGVIYCHEEAPVSFADRRCFEVGGLVNADVYIFPREEYKNKMRLLLNSPYPFFVGDPFESENVDTPYGPAILVKNVTGNLRVYETHIEEIPPRDDDDRAENLK